jgi:MraZ protein
MNRFVGTFTNKIDAKGRVSIPAPYRVILERDGYAGGIYCYPSLDAPAIDAGGERLAQTIDRLLGSLPEYSDERDQLSRALYGAVQLLTLDQDGRILIPDKFRIHAHLATHVTFVGLGGKFQMWEPGRFRDEDARGRERLKDLRNLFGAGRRLDDRDIEDGGGGAGARE